MVPPQFAPKWEPHGILTDPQAVPGPTRLSLLYTVFRKATPKGIPHLGFHCLAPAGSSLAKHQLCVLIFIIVLTDLIFIKFNTLDWLSQYTKDKSF